MKKFPVVFVAFYAVVCGGFPVMTESIDETVQDQRKLSFSTEEINTIRSLVDQVDMWEKKTQDLIKPKLPHFASTALGFLIFSGNLVDSTFDRTTDAGILADNIQRFYRFKVAVGLVTSTSCDVKVQNASRKLGGDLTSLNAFTLRVLRKNSATPPPTQDLSGLKGKLDQTTKGFLTLFGANDKQVMVGGQVRPSVLNNVRNYVILRELGGAMYLFKTDFLHLTGEMLFRPKSSI